MPRQRVQALECLDACGVCCRVHLAAHACGASGPTHGRRWAADTARVRPPSRGSTETWSGPCPLLRQAATATPQGPPHATHHSTHQSNERLNRDAVVFCEMPGFVQVLLNLSPVNEKFETLPVTGAESMARKPRK